MERAVMRWLTAVLLLIGVSGAEAAEIKLITLPGDLQKITVYSAGLAGKSTAQDPAKTFMAYLTRPASKEKFAGAGLDYK